MEKNSKLNCTQSQRTSQSKASQILLYHFFLWIDNVNWFFQWNSNPQIIIFFHFSFTTKSCIHLKKNYTIFLPFHLKCPNLKDSYFI